MTMDEFIELVKANRNKIEGQMVEMPIRLEIRGEGLVTRNGVVVEDDKLEVTEE